MGGPDYACTLMVPEGNVECVKTPSAAARLSLLLEQAALWPGHFKFSRNFVGESPVNSRKRRLEWVFFTITAEERR